MLNVRDYVNDNNCLELVSAEYSLFDGGLIPHPYVTKDGDFAVSRSGRSDDSKNRMSFEEFIKLLVDPSIYPQAKVRCKPNQPGTKIQGGRIVRELNWEFLKSRLIHNGFSSLILASSNPAHPLLSQAMSRPSESMINETQKVEKVSDFLARKIKESGLTHQEIADAVGLESVNVISMLKKQNSRYKVPLERIPAFSAVLCVDPKEFLALAMREYVPEQWKVIERIQGREITDNESEIVDMIRETAGKRRIPNVLTATQRDLLTTFVESLYYKNEPRHSRPGEDSDPVGARLHTQRQRIEPA